MVHFPEFVLNNHYIHNLLFALLQITDLPQSSEYVRPMSSFTRRRPEVKSQHYQEFLERRQVRQNSPHRTSPHRSSPHRSSPVSVSDKILLDSDEDYR